MNYSDWLAANQGNGLPQQQSTAPDISAAYKAGKGGGYATYGDFLASQSQAGAAPQQGVWDSMLGQSQPQGPDMKARGAEAAFGAGVRADPNSAENRAQQQKYTDWQNQQRMAGARRSGVTGDLGTGSYEDVLKAGQASQKASLAAGAKYRLEQERAKFEAEQRKNTGIERGVSNVLNPIGGLGWAVGQFTPGFTDVGQAAGKVQDPLGLGGNANSGFGPGGKFGSPMGMGSAAQGDPFGQYSQDDAGFSEWLSKHGYDTTTGNGGGY